MVAIGDPGASRSSIEGWAMLGEHQGAQQARAAPTPFVQYLRDTKDSDLVVVFGEDAAAVLGLAFAIVAVVDRRGRPAIRAGTRSARCCIGIVLVGVAVFLAVEVKSLLLGEAADPTLIKQITARSRPNPRREVILRCITVQQGPGEIWSR